MTEIKRAESALIVALGSEAVEGLTMAEQIESLACQRNTARSAALEYGAEADRALVALHVLLRLADRAGLCPQGERRCEMDNARALLQKAGLL
jgi:hypothetical protein